MFNHGAHLFGSTISLNSFWPEAKKLDKVTAACYIDRSKPNETSFYFPQSLMFMFFFLRFFSTLKNRYNFYTIRITLKLIKNVLDIPFFPSLGNTKNVSSWLVFRKVQRWRSATYEPMPPTRNLEPVSFGEPTWLDFSTGVRQFYFVFQHDLSPFDFNFSTKIIFIFCFFPQLVKCIKFFFGSGEVYF